MRARPEAPSPVTASEVPVASPVAEPAVPPPMAGPLPLAAGISAGPPVRHNERVTVLDRLMRSAVARRFFGHPLVSRCLAPAKGMGSLAKFLRYSMVSVIAVGISEVVILVCAWVFHFSGVVSNALGAAASTPAAFELNRKWAWGKSGKSHMWKEVVPFWALTLAGLAASTVTVDIADRIAKSNHVTGLDRALAIMGASLFAWGVIWVLKFVIFNRLVFATGPAEAAGSAAKGTGMAAQR